ncbi:polyphosphate kinase 2 [Ancylobacter pratisalsi]|uniref:ADP/GDP-polyphosphate phosphotransferase n=1 Tax=Ancylobacter pratisalsi TaxID=1745854 RepID=A0A6P1YNP8_9HYPH|nr:polyphosphate kinase 2 [Ancylobacter pratisalsi]QIB33843.1 polyphosphate kinase 2 [Ancylobacter pratisalsi]
MTKKPSKSSVKKSSGKNASSKTSSAKKAGAAAASTPPVSKGEGTDGDRELAKALAAFSVDEPLAPAIASRAYGSGHYPYVDRPKRKTYKSHLRDLQIELLKVQDWARRSGERIVIVFEGRDAAGKGGTIHRFVQHLNPRFVRVVALDKPTDVETAQWYFQRYVAHLPYRGEIVIFDRSWYNRAVVEPVMGFCTPQQTTQFLDQVPVFEKMLVEDGIRLFKVWLDIGREMQLKRLHARHQDPLKRWKLSPVDLSAPARWEAISTARNVMIEASHTTSAPWTVVLANDKMRARLGAIRQVLAHLPYERRDDKIIGVPDPAIILDGHTFLDQFARTASVDDGAGQ